MIHRARFLSLSASLVALRCVLAVPQSSAVDWTSNAVGDGAQVSTFAVSRADPARLYLGCLYGGVYRSDDRGDSWTLRSIGLPADAPVNAIETSFVDRNVACVGLPSGVYRTTDGGSSWHFRGAGIIGSVSALCARSDTPSEWIAGTIGRGLFVTTDAGASWVDASPDLAGRSVYSVARQPGAVTTILAGTSLGICRSTDNGATWQPAIGGGGASQVAWGGTPDLAFACSPFIRTTDAGLTWTEVNSPNIWWNVQHVACLQSRVLVGGSWSHGEPWSDPQVARSTDGGQTFAIVLDAFDGVTGFGVTRVAFDPSSASRVYFSGANASEYFEPGDFRRSDSAGARGSWVSKRSGLRHSRVMAVRAGTGSSVFARTRKDLWTSQNGGSSWSRRTFTYPTVETYCLDANARTTNLIHESRSVFYFVGDHIESWSELQRSTSAGSTWTSLTVPIASDSYIRRVASTHGVGVTIYVWVANPKRLYRSDDAGSSFPFVSSTFEPVDAVVDVADPHRVLLLTTENPPVLLSTDGGATWEDRSNGLPRTQGPVRLLMNPANPAALLVAFPTKGVFQSTDGGLNWAKRSFLPPRLTEIPNEGLPIPVVVDAAWKTEGSLSQVFLATNVGVFIEGQGFVNRGLPTRRIHTITYSPGANNIVVGTVGHGAFRITAGSIGGSFREFPTLDVADFVDHPSLVVRPNPTFGSTEVEFTSASEASPVSLQVFDASGRLVRSVFEGLAGPGRQVFRWDGLDEAGNPTTSGVYFLNLVQGPHRESAHIIRLR